ncbi:MAG: AAA family ATPase [Thermofilaceae archaeon]
MSRRVETMLKDLEGKIEILRKNFGEDELEKVVATWEQGRYLDLPLESAELLLVKADYVREQVEQATRRLLRHLSSRYGGVDIFSIRSPRHAYGTGKSQMAALIRNQLRDQGIPTEYLAVGVSSVMSGDFRSRLWECSGLKKAVIFIDEVDLLFSPELKEEDQRKLLEAFANIVIEYSESLSARGDVHQALVLVLSYNAERRIEEFASSRLGRRLMQELLSVDIPLSREDIRELLTTVSALYAHRYGLSGQALWPLVCFINSYTSFLERGFRDRSMGEIVTTSMKYAQSFCEGLSAALRVSEQSVIAMCGVLQRSSPQLGSAIEQMVKEILAKLVPRYEVELPERKLLVTCTFSRSGIDVDGFRADCFYSIALGTIEVGRCLIEVTAARGLDSRKWEQLERFASRYPTLLIHLQEGFEKLTDYEEEGDLYTIRINLEPFKYPAALREFAREQADALAYELANDLKLGDSIEAFLRRSSIPLVYSWLAQQRVREVRVAPTRTEAERKRAEAVESMLRNFIKELGFTSYKKRSKTTVSRLFAENVRPSFDYVDDSMLKFLLSETMKGWAREGLCRLTPKEVHRTDLWNDKRALEIAYDIVAPALRDKAHPPDL